MHADDPLRSFVKKSLAFSLASIADCLSSAGSNTVITLNLKKQYSNEYGIMKSHEQYCTGTSYGRYIISYQLSVSSPPQQKVFTYSKRF